MTVALNVFSPKIAEIVGACPLASCGTTRSERRKTS
jgi:hypothetical protein